MGEVSTEDLIVDCVVWYRDLDADYIDIDTLMYHRKMIATYGVRLGTETAEARKSWKIALVRYEGIKNQKRISFSGRMSSQKADWSARANCEKELSIVSDLEAIFYSMDYLIKSIKEVLSEMNQRIAYLKDEKKQSDFYGKD